MSYEFIRYELPAPHVAAITLARPERLNALHGPLLDELADAVARVAADASLRVFLLTGAARPDGFARSQGNHRQQVPTNVLWLGKGMG